MHRGELIFEAAGMGCVRGKPDGQLVPLCFEAVYYSLDEQIQRLSLINKESLQKER